MKVTCVSHVKSHSYMLLLLHVQRRKKQLLFHYSLRSLFFLLLYIYALKINIKKMGWGGAGCPLTTVRLLFIGWKVQHSSSLDSGSLTSRMHRPSSVFQMRRVPSSDVDTMMSLLRDHAKSVTAPP